MERAARRGRRAQALRPRPRRLLLRRRDPRRARPRRVPRAVPRTLDAGQRVVGLVRPRGEPLLRPTRRPPVGGLHHAQRDGRRRRSPSAGGPAMGGTPRPPSTPTRTPRRRGSPPRRSHPRPRAGRGRSASTSSTGTTSARAPTRTRSRSTSRARPSATPARYASGIPRSPPPSTERRRPSHRRSAFDVPTSARARLARAHRDDAG